MCDLFCHFSAKFQNIFWTCLADCSMEILIYITKAKIVLLPLFQCCGYYTVYYLISLPSLNKIIHVSCSMCISIFLLPSIHSITTFCKFSTILLISGIRLFGFCLFFPSQETLHFPFSSALSIFLCLIFVANFLKNKYIVYMDVFSFKNIHCTPHFPSAVPHFYDHICS